MADRPLAIGIDGRELVGRATGVGRYLAGLLGAWAADPATPHRFEVFLPADPPPALAALGGRVRWTVSPASHAGTRWEQTRLAALARGAGVDVFFAAGYTAPLRLACPTVVAIHDVSYFAHPEWFPWREGLRRRWLTRAAARRARRIVTISAFSAAEIVRWLRVPRDRIHLAPPGAPDVVRPEPPPAREPIVLYAGSLFTRRRIPELIAGFARAAGRVPGARLVLAGDNRARPPLDPGAIAAAHGVGDRVDWRDWVPDADLESLYWRATAFAFLSDYEGFGLTPLEAMAHDVPVVLLDTPVSREVYAGAARFVPPEPAAIGDALAALLTDPDARAAQVAAGRARLARHTWRRAADEVGAALEAAAR